MGIIRHPNHADVDWLAKVPIGPYIGAFKQYLTERRYASSTFAGYLVCITHFARWMRPNRYVEADLAMKEKALASLDAPETNLDDTKPQTRL
jgi:hypothetical protein